MTRKNLLITAVVLLFAAAVPFVYAQTRGHHAGEMGHHGFGMGPMGMGFPRLQHLKSELGLTDEQSAQIKEIMLDTRKANEPYRQATRGSIHDIASILLKDPGNVAAAQAIVDRNVENERLLKTNMLQGVSKALGVLTPEQRTKLGEILASHANRG